jgi:hypothetical protein
MEKMHVVFTFQHVIEDCIINNMTFVSTQSIMQQGGLIRKELGKKFICFGVDGTSFFEGC